MQDLEIDAFFAEMKDVVPLKTTNRVLDHSPSTPTIAQLERRKAAEQEMEFDPNYLSLEAVELLEPHDLLAYKKAGVQEGVYKNLRLGKYQLDATLDLQGKTLVEARSGLFNFIEECHKHSVRSVVIQHGIGLKSKPFPAVLKSYVNKWLQDMPAVLAFHSAQKIHGGLAATYVLLKKSEYKKQLTRELHRKK